MSSAQGKKSAEAVFTKRDGQRTYLIEVVCIFGAISILMASAIAIALVPDSLLQLDSLASLDHWGRSFWPKLRHDANVLDVSTSGRGVRYSIFVLYCVGVVILLSTIMLPITWWAIRRSSERLTYPQASALWKIPLGLSFLLFWNLFETITFGSDTSVGRAITGGSGLWFWTALLWGAFGMTLGGAGVVLAKLWAHGLPESSYEYEKRTPRELM